MCAGTSPLTVPPRPSSDTSNYASNHSSDHSPKCSTTHTFEYALECPYHTPGRSIISPELILRADPRELSRATGAIRVYDSDNVIAAVISPTEYGHHIDYSWNFDYDAVRAVLATFIEAPIPDILLRRGYFDVTREWDFCEPTDEQ
jgi:hypothetical protein